MSNELISWEQRLQEEAKAEAANFVPSVGRISIQSGVMMYGGNPVPGNTVNVIVLAHVFENSWFPKPYSKAEQRNPDCYALAQHKEDLVPADNVPNPINPTCSGCAYLEWGSDPKGGKGKACKEVMRLAVMPVQNVTDPEAVANSEIAVLKIPVTSVKNWANYLQRLSALHGRPAWAVLTEIKVVTDPKTQFKMLFDSKADVTSDEILTALSKRIQMARNALLAPYDKPGEVVEEEAPASGKKKKY